MKFKLKKQYQWVVAAVAVIVVVAAAVGFGEGGLFTGRLLNRRAAAPVPVPTRETCTYIKGLFDQGIFSARYQGSFIKAKLCAENYSDIWYGGKGGEKGDKGGVAEDIVVSEARCALLNEYNKFNVLTPKLRGDFREWFVCEKQRNKRNCKTYIDSYAQGRVSGMGTENQVAYCLRQFPDLNNLANVQKCNMYQALAAQGILSSNYPEYFGAWSNCVEARRASERTYCENLKNLYDQGILTRKSVEDAARAGTLCAPLYPDIWYR